MKILAKNILSILILCLVINISGCSKYKPESVLEITVHKLYVECPSPNTPVYGTFNNELHVGHLGNLEMLRINLERALKYNDSLENTIKCYEGQVENNMNKIDMLMENYTNEGNDLEGWIAMYNGKKLEIDKSEADGIYGAKQIAIKKLKVPKTKQGLLSIKPAYKD